MNRFLVIVILIPLFCFGQKQGNIWYFGDGAGLDFNSGNPVFISGGQTRYIDCIACHAEGTSVICDSSGSLLFYCDGRQIWNKNHQVMPNGDSLLSNISSTQSSLIIPQPGSSRYFYVFTTDDFHIDNLQYGLRYSVVDICLDNDLGNIITGQKNILLLETVTEKLTAVRHNNGFDYWVITHKYYSNAFHAYHLTSNGIADTVISNIGSVHPTGLINTGGAIGQLKASPNGEKLAIVNGNSGNNIAEYFDFDKSTGIVSNHVNIQWNLNYNFYGVSFSPDNSKLYIACTLNGNGIYQFDLNAGGGNPDSVRASRTLIANFGNHLGLQLASNGKIYAARSPFVGNSYLSVINFPNNKGASCNYVDNAIDLNGHGASYGLPNFIDSYDYSNTVSTCGVEPCPPMTLVYSITDATPGLNDGAVKVIVSGGSPPYNYSLDSITFQSSSTFTELDTGIYQVFVIDSNGCSGQGTFTVTYDTTVNLQNLNKLKSIRVFPNPFSDELFIELDKVTDINLKLIDVFGRVILASQYKSVSTVKLDVTQIPQGVYYLEILNNQGEKLHTTGVQRKAG